jgi:hypothetical protein
VLTDNSTLDGSATWKAWTSLSAMVSERCLRVGGIFSDMFVVE